MACSLLSGCHNPKAETELSVMSYNIRNCTINDGDNNWDLRKDASIAMIRDLNPDIFGVQEGVDTQAYFLKEQLPEYVYFGIGRDDGLKKGVQIPIYYRRDRFECMDTGYFWLSETPDIPSKGWDAAHIRMVAWVKLKVLENGKVVNFFNTHFDHQGKIAQQESAKLAVDRIGKISGKDIAIFLGDFNLRPDNEALAPIAKEFVSVRDAAEKTDHSGTFNGWGRMPADRRPLIDHIYYKGDVKPVLFEVVTKGYEGRGYVSDHFPIIAVFKL